MNTLQLRHLTNFCKENEIDTHEIDSTLTYQENLHHLQNFAYNFDSMLGEARNYEAMERAGAISLADKYGMTELQDSGNRVPPKLYTKTVIRIYKRAASEKLDVYSFFADICQKCPFSKTCFARVRVDSGDRRGNVLKITGVYPTQALASIKLREHGVRFIELRSLVKHRGFEFTALGWIKSSQSA